MTALKYWNGTAWVTIPDNSAKQIWTGPDAPVPLGDNRLWIDTDEADPTLVGGNAWQSQNYAPATAAVLGWKVTPIPTDANFIKNGDAAAFVRNADGSLTVRDAGVYVISASVSSVTGGQAMLCKGVDETVANVNNYLMQSGVSGNLCSLAWTGYLPAGQIISIISYVGSSAARQTLHFDISRILAGPQGPPGPPGPGAIIDTQRFLGLGVGYRAYTSGAPYTVYADAAGAVPMRLTYTPPVNCWWEVTYFMGTIWKQDAAYHYGYAWLGLTPADVDGFGANQAAQALEEQHSTVQTYAFRTGTVIYKLQAGVAYTCGLFFTAQGGTWSYGTDGVQHHMQGKAWAR